MVIAEITEEKDEDYDDHYSSIDREAQKTRIRQILKNQKYMYLSNSSSASSSSSSASTLDPCSFSSSRRTLMELMRGRSSSLRRLFDMERTTLGSFFNEYSASPLIKPILLWGSSEDEDGDQGRDRDPWAMIKKDVGRMKQRLPRGPPSFGDLSGFASERSARSFSDDDDDDGEGGKIRVPIRSGRSGRRKLSRKKSFRKLPGFGSRRWIVFRFRLIRRLKIMICGKKF